MQNGGRIVPENFRLGGSPCEIASTLLGGRFMNVWTPSLRPADKRPVMFWLHGGGFITGSDGRSWFDGSNLARKHDVVVVGINHRLNIFGYLYLAQLGGPKYANSGNVGMLDAVLALQWVRDKSPTSEGIRET